jgi:hypothetical protein
MSLATNAIKKATIESTPGQLSLQRDMFAIAWAASYPSKILLMANEEINTKRLP